MYLGNKPNTYYETFYKVILMPSQERYNFSDLSIKMELHIYNNLFINIDAIKIKNMF